MKLSKAQKEVIKLMQDRQCLHYLQGINSHCFFARKAVSWATIYKLETLNLIKRVDRYCILTKLGEEIKL